MKKIIDNEALENKEAEAKEAEILNDNEAEFINSDYEEQDDNLRNDALQKMRTICDSVHPSLKIKMPFIENRETPRSVITKFIKSNNVYVSPKYENIRMDSLTTELANDILNDTISNIKVVDNNINCKKIKGFTPTQFGAVDVNF